MKKSNKLISAFLSATMFIQLIPGLVFAENSQYFEATLPDIEANFYEPNIIENVQDYLPEEMHFGLMYASTEYQYNMSELTWYTFTNDNYTNSFHEWQTMLKYRYDDGDCYDLEVPFFCDLPTGTYTLTIELPIANEKGAEDVKPYRLTVENYSIVNPTAETGIFKWTLPDFTSEEGETTVIENIEELLPTAMHFGLGYASTSYEEYIYTPAKFTFTSGSELYDFTSDDVPLINTGDSYNLEIPFFEDLPGGTYSLKIELDVADQKEARDVKPYTFIIDNFTVNNPWLESPYFEATLPDVELDGYSSYTIKNLMSYLPEEMHFGLLYASNKYKDDISGGTVFTLTGENYSTTFEGHESYLMRTSRNYNLKIPFVTDAPTGTYKLVMELPIANEKGAEDVKPYKFTIENYTINNPSYEDGYFEWTLPDITVDAGETFRTGNIQQHFPDGLHYGLYYVSDNYDVGEISYYYIKKGSATGNAGRYTSETSPLKQIDNNVYNLEFDVPDLSAGEYTLTMKLPAAKGNKPFHIRIENLVINNDTPTLPPSEVPTEEPSETPIVPPTITPTPPPTTEPPTLPPSEAPTEEPSETPIVPPTITPTPPPTTETPTDAPGQCHDFTDWYVEKAPTEEEIGLKIRKCTICGEEESEEIPALGYKNTTFNVADTQTLNMIENATVHISDKSGKTYAKAVTDDRGNAFVDLENGIYNVHVIADGYQMRSFVVEKKDESSSFTVYMNKNDILDITADVHEMTYDEIINAGIDVDAIGNKHIYNCAAVIKFIPVYDVEGSIEITPIEINLDYIYDEKGTIIKYDVCEYEDMMIYPVHKDIYLIVYSTTTWLKEMFDVQLVVANTSSVETIEDCVASINLPEGLSFADMIDGEQETTVNLGNIEPNGVGDIHWYLRGDKEGEYYVNGSVSATRTGGGISEPLNASFRTSSPISVLAGSAMKLVIEAEKTAIANKPYKMRYTLQNVSNKTINNLELNVAGGKFLKAYSVTEVLHEALMFNMDDTLYGDFNNGLALKDDYFCTAEILSGIFEIKFGVGLDSLEAVKYMVEQMFTVTGNGSTTEIPTEIILVDKITEHHWDWGKETVHPTCESEGKIVYTCLDGCGEQMIVTVMPLNHSYGAWNNTKEATCKQAGERTRICLKCGHNEIDFYGKGDHVYDNGEIITHSTQTAPGVIRYTCTLCGHPEEKDAPLLAGGGSFGTNNTLEWMMYEDGKFFVEGSGSVTDYDAVSQTPWADYRSEIKEIIISDGVTQIGRLAFSRCSALTSVTIPDSVNTIKGTAFKDCSALTEIVIPESVTSIGKKAFMNCTSLTQVTIPDTMVTIKDNAFSGCTSLNTIYFEGGRPQWEKIKIATGNDTLKDEYIYYEIPSVKTSAEAVSVYAPKEECTLLVATYRDGLLVDRKLVEVTSSIEKTIDQIGVNTSETDTVKVFLWNGENSIIPLCNSASAEIN